VIELLSYTFYIPNSACAVFFEFSDYKRFIEKTDEYKNVPSPIFASLKSLCSVILTGAIFLFGTPYFDINICYSDEYATWPFWYKVFFYHIAMTVRRFYYYIAFCFITAAI